MTPDNSWDKLSYIYDTTKEALEIPPRVADHILIAWPVLVNFIKQYGSNKKNVRVLEYGCGSGSFANKLSTLGYKVTGVDSSKELIKLATSAYGDRSDFIHGDSSILSTLQPFSIITSIMTFQFIEDIEKSFRDLDNVLVKDGIFIFAVHNPELIKEYIEAGILFEDFDSNENPKKGTLNLHGTRIPIFIRNANEYNQILQSMGFEPLLESYPPFTKEFLENYPTTDPTDKSEFLILGYRKVS